MRKLRPGKEKDTQGHQPYWQQYSGESFSSQPSKPPTGWDIPSRWLLGSQWGFRSWKHLEKAVIGHNLVSHFFTISFWFSEVGQKNENCWAMEWGMTFLAPDMGRAGICMQGFVDMNFPFKGPTMSFPRGWSSSGDFLGCQDGNPILTVQDMFWCQCG